MPDDIYRNGSPQGSHSGPTEHNHIVHVKQPVQTTQKRRQVIDKQISKRVTESHVINVAMNMMESTPIDSNDSVHNHADGIPRNATTWIYAVRREGTHVKVTNKAGSTGVHHWLLHFLVGHVSTNFLDHKHFHILIHSECYCNGHLLRANPSYRGSHEWYDWAMVRWHKDPQDDSNFTEKPHLWFGESKVEQW